MVLVKIGAVLFVIVGIGCGYGDWRPFMPYGWTGVFSNGTDLFA